MDKVRVYELARDIGITSPEAIRLLKDKLQIRVKSASSTIEEDVAIKLKRLIRLEGAPPGAMQTLNGPCQSGPLVAKYTDSGPVVDAWEGKFCFGDYWTIPSGGLIKNAANDPIAVRSGSTTHTVVIGPGRTGSLEAPCADPPIIVGTDADEELVPPRLEPFCVGDVWVIEEP